jgi:perosamine synthetase
LQPACAPITPFLRHASLTLRNRSPLPTLLDSGDIALTTSGRTALALALEQLGIGPGDEVLLPAYHCVAMTAPIRALGATPVFYPLRADLSVASKDVETRVGPRVRSVLVVHFFGFPQPLRMLRETCDRARVSLIEDCAHTFYGSSGDAPPGRSGDFAIGSLMKFFPTFDGGCLVSFRRPLARLRMESRGTLFQVKAAVHILERSAQWADSRSLRTLVRGVTALSAWAKRANSQLSDQLAQVTPRAVFGSADFEPAWVRKRMSMASKFVVSHVDHGRAIKRRRAFFGRYLAGLAGVRGGRPLHASLPDGVVPYVFPFLLSDPDRQFSELRAAGVPLYRWEEVAIHACPVAAEYRDALVQFPCHQELSDRQIGALIERITAVVDVPRIEQAKASCN